MRILHVIDRFDGNDAAGQISLLAPALKAAGHIIEVCCIGSADRQADALRRHRITLHVLGWTRWLDSSALWELRRLLRAGAWDAIHVWHLPSLRAVAVVARECLSRVIVSSPWPERGTLNWWERRTLRLVRCIAVGGESERQRCIREGLGDVRWHAVPPAAPTAEPAAQAKGEATLRSLQKLPSNARRIVCAGRLECGRGFREAVWTADIVGHLFPDVHLLIAGSGPRQLDLAEMIHRLEIPNVHLVGDGYSLSDLLAGADLFWAPSRVDRGRQTALEAMALGRAVVATDVPCLRELITDGETGCVVPPGDPVALARRTRTLLLDAERRECLGAAARAHVLEHFSLPRVAGRWLELYDDVRASRAA